MLTKIQNWGNSQGVRIPKAALQETELKVGDEVDIVAEFDRIVISLKNQIRGKYLIENLVAEISVEFQAEELDWGSAEGQEAW